MSAGFRRHLVGKTLRNICYCEPRLNTLSWQVNGRVTVTSFRSISMPAGFRRHFVGSTLRNVPYCDIV